MLWMIKQQKKGLLKNVTFKVKGEWNLPYLLIVECYICTKQIETA